MLCRRLQCKENRHCARGDAPETKPVRYSSGVGFVVRALTSKPMSFVEDCSESCYMNLAN